MKFSILFALITSMGVACGADQPNQSIPVSDMHTVTQGSPMPSGKTEIATLGGGCFWCVEAIYQDLKGVSKVESGYSGGHIDKPTYREVCSGLTGHAEVIQVTFDPEVISYRDILRIFFTVHDPTTLNRQGNDKGTQYRSVIYYHSEEQKKIAEEVKVEAKEAWDDPIVTEISAFDKFFKAEDYHQNYYKDNPNEGYCSFIIAPKVKKFREKFKDRLKQ